MAPPSTRPRPLPRPASPRPLAWVVGLAMVATIASAPALGDDTSAPPADALTAALDPAEATPPAAPSADAAARLKPLDVPGFAAALHAPPLSRGDGPRPIVVFLHGIRADPHEQCAQWASVARAYGWLLCPRGEPDPDAPKRLGLWTHSGAHKTHIQLEAALNALQARYPGQVAAHDMILAGYSRGAILAPKLATMTPDRYRYLILAEGGLDQLERVTPERIKRAGVHGVALAMGTFPNRRRGRHMRARLEDHDLPAVFIDMPRAGHRIGPDFPRDGLVGLSALLHLAPPERDSTTLRPGPAPGPSPNVYSAGDRPTGPTPPPPARRNSRSAPHKRR